MYIGTASKLIAPSLRVAWIAPPHRLRERLRVELESRGLVVNEATGLALAEFIASGALSTHHARVTRTYAARRAALVAAVSDHVPGAVLEGVDAGLGDRRPPGRGHDSPGHRRRTSGAVAHRRPGAQRTSSPPER